MEKIKLGPLEALAQRNSSHQTAVILLHGYGAHMGDLAPLANALPVGPQYDWFFPDGLLSLPWGAFPPSKAWFPLDMLQLEKALKEGTFESLLGRDYPAGFQSSVQAVAEFVKEVQKNYTQIILGGFSQGSMLALELAFGQMRSIHKLVLFSTSLVAEKTWEEKLASPPDFAIFQSHGMNDPVLPLAPARKLKRLFEKANLNLEYHEFPGGHEIPPTVLMSFNDFLLSPAVNEGAGLK